MMSYGRIRPLPALDSATPSQDLPQHLSASLQPEHSPQRRHLLRSVLAAGGVLAAPGALAANTARNPAARERRLALYAPHTGESLRLTYWTPDDGYIGESLREFDHMMRDRHNDKIKPIDRKLLDIIYLLQLKLQPRQPVQMLSGYRSPETNERMRRTNKGVARKSFHIRGMAVDIRMPDRDFKRLHKAALALQAGGVGRYRRSAFIHIDTGHVRHWG